MKKLLGISAFLFVLLSTSSILAQDCSSGVTSLEVQRNQLFMICWDEVTNVEVDHYEIYQGSYLRVDGLDSETYCVDGTCSIRGLTVSAYGTHEFTIGTVGIDGQTSDQSNIIYITVPYPKPNAAQNCKAALE